MFVIEQLSGGGAERVTAALANELCQRDDLKIHLITYTQDQEQDYPTDERVVRHNLGISAENRVEGIRARAGFMRRVVRQIDPYCVVSLATPRMTVLLSLALIGLRVPLILSERNDPRRFPASGKLRTLRNLAYRACDGVVFQTHDAMNFFSSRIRRKGTVISNPITSNLPLRYEGEREKRIINCCRLTEQKNLDLLIEAFSDIAAEFPEYGLEIFGDGPERERLEQKVQQIGLRERVRFPGYSNQIYEQMHKAAVFVSSSDYEGISNSMLEAIAIGVPSVCTDCPVGGARETIRHGVNGMLVPTGDRSAMASAIRKVLSDQELSEAMSKAGSELRNEISVAVIAQRWLDFIRKIVDRRV